MSDQPITLYDCKAGDVFEMNRDAMQKWFTHDPILHKEVWIAYGTIYQKRIVFTAHDSERDVYTVECR